jgi:hypothetical protein
MNFREEVCFFYLLFAVSFRKSSLAKKDYSKKAIEDEQKENNHYAL